MADEGASNEPGQEGGRPKSVLALAIALGAAVVAIAAAWRWLAPAPTSTGPIDEPDTPATGSAASASSAAVAARCVEIAPGKAFLVGDAPAPKPAPPPPDPSSPVPDPGAVDVEDELAPFAVEVGRATTFDGGFAVGTLRAGEGGALAMIAMLDKDGGGGRLVKLARSRGDMDPPVVAGRGRDVLAAMMEPNAGGRAIRIARVTADEVTWGLELSEGRDESTGLDIVASGARALVAWDDLPAGQDHTRVMIAAFDPSTMKADAGSRPASPAKMDAESPRLTARPGGFWLTWLARGKAIAKPGADGADGGAKTRPKKPDDEVDETKGGEGVDAAWLEVVPLDDHGAPTAAAVAATPRDGHVLAYDVAAGEGDALLIAWRDDDTPSGSSGGVVSLVRVTPAGVGEARVVADEGIGTGVPTLLPGWIAVSPVSGAKRIARLGADGSVLDPPTPEPAIGTAEPLAALEDRALVARPVGRAMRLSVIRCVR